MKNCNDDNRMPMRLAALLFMAVIGISSADDTAHPESLGAATALRANASPSPHRFADAELRHASQWRSLAAFEVVHPLTSAGALLALMGAGWLLAAPRRRPRSQ